MTAATGKTAGPTELRKAAVRHLRIGSLGHAGEGALSVLSGHPPTGERDNTNGWPAQRAITSQ